MLWNIDPDQIAQGYGISRKDFIDSVSGSTTSAVTEAKVALLVNGERVVDKQLPYDVIAEGREYEYIEVRNICKTRYVYFSPSTATGKGRFFSEEDHQKKLEACDSYVYCDLRDRFESSPKFYEVSVTKVQELQGKGIINQGKILRSLFFEVFPYEQYALKLRN